MVIDKEIYEGLCFVDDNKVFVIDSLMYIFLRNFGIFLKMRYVCLLFFKVC